MGSIDLQDWTRIRAMNLSNEFVLVFDVLVHGQIRGRGRAREHLAEERFMGSLLSLPQNSE